MLGEQEVKEGVVVEVEEVEGDSSLTNNTWNASNAINWGISSMNVPFGRRMSTMKSLMMRKKCCLCPSRKQNPLIKKECGSLIQGATTICVELKIGSLILMINSKNQ